MAIIIGREVGEGGTLEWTLESPGQVDSQRQLDSSLPVICVVVLFSLHG